MRRARHCYMTYTYFNDAFYVGRVMELVRYHAYILMKLISPCSAHYGGDAQPSVSRRVFVDAGRLDNSRGTSVRTSDVWAGRRH